MSTNTHWTLSHRYTSIPKNYCSGYWGQVTDDQRKATSCYKRGNVYQTIFHTYNKGLKSLTYASALLLWTFTTMTVQCEFSCHIHVKEHLHSTCIDVGCMYTGRRHRISSSFNNYCLRYNVAWRYVTVSVLCCFIRLILPTVAPSKFVVAMTFPPSIGTVFKKIFFLSPLTVVAWVPYSPLSTPIYNS